MIQAHLYNDNFIKFQGGAIAILLGAEQPDLFEGVVMIAPAIGTDPNVATPLKVSYMNLLI